MENNKTAFLSGKLVGTRTLENELNSIKLTNNHEKVKMH